jgi:hypothetical protein
LKNLDIILNKDKIINNLDDYVIGYLDLEKWKKFLEQFSAVKTSILMINFQTENLSYALREINIEENKTLNNDDNNENNNKLNIKEQLEIIFDDLLEGKIEFRPTKNYFDRLNDYFLKLKIRFTDYYPYSYIVVAIFFTVFISFLLPSPGIKVKKQ